VKLFGLLAVSAWGFRWWLRAPFPSTVSVQDWRAFGVIGAAVIGGVGALTIGSWTAVSAAAAMGFVIGAAWTDTN